MGQGKGTGGFDRVMGAAKSSFSRVSLGATGKGKVETVRIPLGEFTSLRRAEIEQDLKEDVGSREEVCLLGVEDVTALFENVPVKRAWGGMKDGETAYYKLLDCYQLSRKEGHL